MASEGLMKVMEPDEAEEKLEEVVDEHVAKETSLRQLFSKVVHWHKKKVEEIKEKAKAQMELQMKAHGKKKKKKK